MMWSGAFTEMNKSNLRAICDAGPLIHLDELNCIHLLSDFREIILPNTVWEEVNHHRPGALLNKDISFRRIREGYPMSEVLRSMCRAFSLDAGETEALTIVEKVHFSIFFTDDASARLVADRMGFRVHGTIGIIVRAIRKNYMNPNRVIQVLSDIPSKSSLYIKTSLLEEVIMEVRKEFPT